MRTKHAHGIVTTTPPAGESTADDALTVLYLLADDALATLDSEPDNTRRLLDMMMNLIESQQTITAEAETEWGAALTEMIETLR